MGLPFCGIWGPQSPCQCQANDKRAAPTCCVDAFEPCPVHPSALQQGADTPPFAYVHDPQNDTRALTRTRCVGAAVRKKPYPCCPIRPTNETERAAGFSTPYVADSARGGVELNGIELWPYGGRTYVLSVGLLDAITLPSLRECVDKIMCGNADQQVAQCLFHNGFGQFGRNTRARIHSLSTLPPVTITSPPHPIPPPPYLPPVNQSYSISFHPIHSPRLPPAPKQSARHWVGSEAPWIQCDRPTASRVCGSHSPHMSST